jgi:hypothetical protein
VLFGCYLFAILLKQRKIKQHWSHCSKHE